MQLPVEIVHFNPRRTTHRLGLNRFGRARLSNFGDIIGPDLVRRIVADRGLVEPEGRRRLVGVGSIMKLARPGDTVWGSGVNGKSMAIGGGSRLDIRAVRGPRTRQVLLNAGAQVPPIYGDPILLWERFWPRDSYRKGASARPVIVVPNFHDLAAFESDARVVSPLASPEVVIGAIARSDFVCGSSLHGIVVAESFGVPARLIRSAHEPAFKYDDYYESTGRPNYRAATSVDEAIALGGEDPPRFDAEALLDAFPADLWLDP